MSIASIYLVCATAQPSLLFHFLLIYIESCLAIIVFRGQDQWLFLYHLSSSLALLLRHFLFLYLYTWNIERLIRTSTFSIYSLTETSFFAFVDFEIPCLSLCHCSNPWPSETISYNFEHKTDYKVHLNHRENIFKHITVC